MKYLSPSRPIHLLRYIKKVVIWPFERELRIVRRFLTKDSIAVDVGANTGLYTEAIGRHCETVFAFEPDSQCYSYLSNVRARNWVVENMAASNCTGNAALRTPVLRNGLGRGFGTLSTTNSFSSSGCSEIDEQSVHSVRLDEYFASKSLLNRRISFVKIDVEGFEYEVLQGAVETLRAHRPAFLIECEFRHSDAVGALFEFFRTAQYASLRCDLEVPTRLTPVTEDQLRAFQRMGGPETPDRCLQSNAYINNVVFVPQEMEIRFPRLLCA